MKIIIIDALDHFGTNSNEVKRVVARFIGEFIEENDEYITIRYIRGNILNKDYEDDIHRIVKSTILNQKSVEVEYGIPT